MARSLTLASKPAASTVTKCVAPDARQVDAAGRDADDDVRGQLRVGAGDVEVAGDVVAGAGRDDAEAGVGAGERLHREVHHPVAADHHEALDAVGDAALGQLAGLVGVPADQAAHRKPASLSRGSAIAAVRVPRPLPGGRVRQERDLSGHAASLRGRGGLPVRRYAWARRARIREVPP